MLNLAHSHVVDFSTSVYAHRLFNVPCRTCNAYSGRRGSVIVIHNELENFILRDEIFEIEITREISREIFLYIDAQM